jgi:hypothetical protein
VGARELGRGVAGHQAQGNQAKERGVSNEQDWISQAEAARLCKVSPQTIRRWIDQQLIRVRKLPSGRLQVDRWSLDRVIQVIG